MKNFMKRYGITTGDVVIVIVILVLSIGILAVAVGTKHFSRSDDTMAVSGSAGTENADSLMETNALAELPSEAVQEPETLFVETAPLVPDTASAAVEQKLAEMTLEEKIYQMFIVTPEVLVDNAVSCVTETGDTTRNALTSMPVGGIIYFSQNLESSEQTKQMISAAQDCMAENGNVGLWIAVDEEGGLVARVADKLGTTAYSPMQTYGAQGDTDRVYNIGADIASDIAQFGFNLDFAPVADVNIDPNNELGDRIFSDDPEVVSEMVGSMVRGIQSTGQVSATLKHFPGLGAENGNTHNDVTTYIERTHEQLVAEEFVGFQGGIDAGADFVMVGHHIMSCAGDDLPSDLSEVVVTYWLRDELGYDGVVVTDAHNMNTISGSYSPGEAARLAISAGVDIVLMPTDLHAAYQGVYDAVQQGEIPESRIDESVKRILTAKEKHGLLDKITSGEENVE